MGKSLLPFTTFFQLLMVEVQAIRGSCKPQDSDVKLFVFGDSYVDTGNAPKLSTDSWRKPYGLSFSMQHLQCRMDKRKYGLNNLRESGMNFAYGGQLINQLTLTLKSIHDLGVRKIGVVAIEPLGCLPRFTVPSSVQRCNRNLDLAAKSHNLRLHRAVHKLRKENNGSVFPQSVQSFLICNGQNRRIIHS
ncbi:GDSL esterase/lipase [Camellia lanceoleosa]|uniref:GDSL esterase/lipase n=1 Tax=Camellia lanceoleosa TaxID=1840588 RepID=A0ACC0J6Z2_9ERIC|nr:GDSL esterase/lipase [Camellia lanceoleosa]